jgi:hypothetical protein
MKYEKVLSIRLRPFVKRWQNKVVNMENHAALMQDFRNSIGLSILVSQKRDFEQWYFRARLGAVNDETNPNEFSYPPANLVDLGRCNLAQKPVFYGSEQPSVALTEVGFTDSSTCYLSLWRSGDNHPNYAQFFWDRNPVNERMRIHYEARKENLLKIRPHETSKAVLSLLHLTTKMFLGEDDIIAAAFAHDALYNSDEYDGIEYPDAKSRSSYNFALHPRFADRLHLDSVYELVGQPNEQIERKRIGFVVDDKLEWREFRNDDCWTIRAKAGGAQSYLD